MAKAMISELSRDLSTIIRPLTGASSDYDPLLEMIGGARFVLIGEMSHGTHEFYQERAEITKRLIREKDFRAIAVEADWPDAFRINRFVRGSGHDRTPNDALADFQRFPTWMWRNSVVLDFVGWLRAHNESQKEEVGFYGLDLYSLHASINAVLSYLKKVDPEAERRARFRYACFDHFGEDAQSYGYAASFNLESSCEKEVIGQLVELRRHAADYATRDGRIAADEYFFAEQNARLIKNAEKYYRTMFHARESWNLRDRHMAETLDQLSEHFSGLGIDPKIVVWAHNSHLGDASATQMKDLGELNLGQLVREKHGTDAVLIGLTTYTGMVTAATEWDGPAERKRVRPSLEESYEAAFHHLNLPRSLCLLREARMEALNEPRLQRAIGVIYRPQTERISHYLYARLADQFDAVLHFDETTALEPLDRSSGWEVGEAPETYPFGY